ncbi:MAG: L,D-transpeptidase family protein [Candidatus Obscuribacterales bacterium]|nr:L,D-transpeptidase family protein [Steroidobacteraceae bacterium]
MRGFEYLGMQLQRSIIWRWGGSALLLALALRVPIYADEVSASVDGVAATATTSTGGVVMADTILVRKAERRMYLMRRGEVLRSFRIALGLRPQGHKEYEGDYRTPEGRYRLVRRNSRSEFFLSMAISYPNSEDQARAQRRGKKPGGAIMLHGWPNIPRKNSQYYASADWTDGCIAVSNSDMVEIWLMTPLDTPIEITP